MAASSKQAVERTFQFYELVKIYRLVNKSLGLGNKRYLLEQCWKVEIYIPKIRRKLQLSCITGPVAFMVKEYFL
jgi:hypothetical protein